VLGPIEKLPSLSRVQPRGLLPRSGRSGLTDVGVALFPCHGRLHSIALVGLESFQEAVRLQLTDFAIGRRFRGHPDGTTLVVEERPVRLTRGGASRASRMTDLLPRGCLTGPARGRLASLGIRSKLKEMNTLKARVVNGRIVVDEPTKLPEGTVLELVVADAGDELDEDERRALHEALNASWEQVKSGDVRPARDFLDELKRGR